MYTDTTGNSKNICEKEFFVHTRMATSKWNFDIGLFLDIHNEKNPFFSPIDFLL